MGGLDGFITEEAFHEGQGAEVGEVGCEFLKETQSGGVGAYAGTVIPATAFFEVASNGGVAVGAVIGGEDGFENENMGAVIAEVFGGPSDAVAKRKGVGFAVR